MAISQSDIDSLNAAIASGIRSATVGGQTVIYNTTTSMIEARNDLQKQLSLQNQGTSRRKQTQLFYSGRGY